MESIKTPLEKAEMIIRVTHPRLVFVNGVHGSGKRRVADSFKQRDGFTVIKLEKGKSVDSWKNTVSSVLKRTPEHVSVVVIGSIFSVSDVDSVFSGPAELFAYLQLYVNDGKSYYEKVKKKHGKQFARDSIKQNKEIREEHSKSFEMLIAH